MNLYSIYFSPTGGTKKVLDLICENLAESHSDIDFSLHNVKYSDYSFSENDLCLIGVPSFVGRVPSIALEHLRQINANGASAVLVVAFGNRAYDDTLLELKNEASARGFRIIAAIAAATEHSIMHQYGTGRPDVEDVKELHGFALQIKEVLSCGKKLSEVSVPGHELYKEIQDSPLKPQAGEFCTKCGICATQCPAGAIPKENPAKTDNTLCISCMRCIAVCPSHSRSLDSDLLFKLSQKLKEYCTERKENELYLSQSR